MPAKPKRLTISALAPDRQARLVEIVERKRNEARFYVVEAAWRRQVQTRKAADEQEAMRQVNSRWPGALSDAQSRKLQAEVDERAAEAEAAAEREAIARFLRREAERLAKAAS